MGGNEHVSERFGRLLALYRKPDGGEWGGQDLQNATGGAVTRSYVANLKNGRIGNPGLAKLEAISEAMGFPPALWFGDVEEHERLVDRWAERNPGMVNQSDAAIARERLKMARRSIER